MTDPRLRKSFPGIKEQEPADDRSALAKIAGGRRQVRKCEMLGHTFVWRVLSGTEKQDCLGGAVQRFADLGIPTELRVYSDLEDELCWQVLWHAMRDPEIIGTDSHPYPRAYAASVSECRDVLTVDERDMLIIAYMDFQEEINPAATEPAMFSAQIEEVLKKNDDSTQQLTDLINFGSHSLATYLLTMASQQSSSPNPNSSPTSSNETN